jgi:hypothetical protein
MRFPPKFSEMEWRRHILILRFECNVKYFMKPPVISRRRMCLPCAIVKGERAEALCARGNEVYYLVRSIEP